MSAHENTQPAHQAPMGVSPEMREMAKKAGTEYVKGAAKEGGKDTMQYEQANGQQQFDDAKAQAQGLWAKYCGCFSS